MYKYKHVTLKKKGGLKLDLKVRVYFSVNLFIFAGADIHVGS